MQALSMIDDVVPFAMLGSLMLSSPLRNAAISGSDGSVGGGGFGRSGRGRLTSSSASSVSASSESTNASEVISAICGGMHRGRASPRRFFAVLCVCTVW